PSSAEPRSGGGMNWVIYLLGSGAAFFLGAGLLLAAPALFSNRRRWLSRRGTPVVLLGLGLVAVSATPLPYWFYAVAAGLTLCCMITEEAKSDLLRRRRVVFRALAAAVWLVAVALELPYQFAPTVSAAGRPKVYIIGDSVTAGMGERGVETWP